MRLCGKTHAQVMACSKFTLKTIVKQKTLLDQQSSQHFHEALFVIIKQKST
jgi:hypothetical protein